MIKSLDYLRAIAALTVFLSHTFQIYWLPTIGLVSWKYELNHFLSETAVLLFFVLSGYVISNSLHSNTQRNGGRLSVLDYASSRLLRIYPPLIVSIIISLVAYSVIVIFELPGSVGTLKAPGDIYQARDYLSIGTRDIVNSLLMNNGLLQMNGPLWSLCIEAKLYFYACLVVIIFIHYKQKNLLNFIANTGFLVLSVFLFFNTKTDIYYGLWWLSGGVIFLYRRNFIKFMTLVVVMAIVVFAMAVIGQKFVSLPVQVIFVYSLFLAAIKCKVPEIKAMNILANTSYTLYIVHFPMLLLSYAIFSYNFDVYGSLTRELMSSLSLIIILTMSIYIGKWVERPANLRLTYHRLLRKVKV
ncbi:acyltransferase family protein [Methylobacillus glycogenes]|uniref:acyltransferase family protein n=1 Tax=Methylobacillus glycogenes TaxID=406 RepID=UPI00046E6399|nr:acyltransferase [Methylobacillus glycogenes]